MEMHVGVGEGADVLEAAEGEMAVASTYLCEERGVIQIVHAVSVPR